MANVKISELPVATAAVSTDRLPVVQGGVTKQMTNAVLLANTANSTLGNVITGYTTGRLVINPSNDVTPAADTSNSFWLADFSIPINNYANARFDGSFTGSGGTPGFVSSGVRLNNTVAAGRTDFVWGLTSVLDNSATAGENVAIYGQGNKLAGAGPTWAGAFEARDKSNAANPTTGLVGLEVDVFANGTDANNNRVGVDIVGGKGVAGGARNEIAYGSRVGSVNGATADSLFYQGYAVTAAAYVGFDCSAAPLEGDKIAFRMANDQWLSFVPTNNRLLGYTTSGLTYSVSGISTLTYSDAGELNVNIGKFYVTAAGKVGIGTTAPAEALDVVGNVFLSGQSTADQAIRVGQGRTGNGNSYVDLQGDATYVNGLRLIRNNGGANTSSSLIHRGTGALSIVAQEAGAITLNTTNLERMRIASDGSVGIGTTNPSFFGKFVVAGSGTVGAVLVGDSTAETKFTFTSNTAARISNFSNTPLIFDTNNIERMRITPTGDVGIGTSSPASFGKLAVAGTGTVNAAIVGNSTGPTKLLFVTNTIARITNVENTDLTFDTNNTERMRITSGGDVLVTGVGGLGYGTGSGGAVTQLTSRATGVTLNKTNGAITMFSAAGSATAATFTVTNSTIAATDVVHVSVKSATNVYLVFVTATAAGSFNITFQTTGGVATDAPVINFAVIKAVVA